MVNGEKNYCKIHINIPAKIPPLIAAKKLGKDFLRLCPLRSEKVIPPIAGAQAISIQIEPLWYIKWLDRPWLTIQIEPEIRVPERTPPNAPNLSTNLPQNIWIRKVNKKKNKKYSK